MNGTIIYVILSTLPTFYIQKNEELTHTWHFSLIAATEKIGDYNTRSIQKYNMNGTPKAQDTQR